MKKKHNKNVTVYNNTIHIYKLENQFCVSDFIRAMKKALLHINKNNLSTIYIDCHCSKQHIFPDACVPIAALITQYRDTYNIDIQINTHNNSYLKNCHFDNPLILSADELKNVSNPLNKIFVYDTSFDGNEQIACINQLFIDYINKTVECEEGVLTGMLWCIYEIMDNVLVHSQCTHGYIMAQYHKKTQRLAICIYDCGIGIYNSLIKGTHNPKSEIDAIKLAIQEGVGDGQGQGNGLYGLSQFVKANGGRLVISSGTSTVQYKNKSIKEWDNNPIFSDAHPSTTIDFQLNLSNKTDLKNALRSIGGITEFDVRIEDMIQEDSDIIKYIVSEQAVGTSTRQSGRELRIDVINILKRYHQPIIIDFSNILIASSSFMDEFIAIMCLELGYVQFNQLISLINMNENVAYICNRAIAMRINQEWNS